MNKNVNCTRLAKAHVKGCLKRDLSFHETQLSKNQLSEFGEGYLAALKYIDIIIGCYDFENRLTEKIDYFKANIINSNQYTDYFKGVYDCYVDYYNTYLKEVSQWQK